MDEMTGLVLDCHSLRLSPRGFRLVFPLLFCLALLFPPLLLLLVMVFFFELCEAGTVLTTPVPSKTVYIDSPSSRSPPFLL